MQLINFIITQKKKINMKKVIKVFKSKYWDLFPALAFIVIAGLEGTGYWIGGISVIIWLFSMAVRHLVK